MFDEMDRLRSMKGLLLLLSHYGALGAKDRQVWQDRLQEMEDMPPRELIKLHGELMACGFLEQNTGVTPVLRAGSAPGCYRITPAGVRALKQIRAEEMQMA
jgi:hypothetical protein